MIIDYLLFEDAGTVEDAIDDFKRYNPFLDVRKWNFIPVGTSLDGIKVKAVPRNGRSFYVFSPVHFWKWAF